MVLSLVAETLVTETSGWDGAWDGAGHGAGSLAAVEGAGFRRADTRFGRLGAIWVPRRTI
jgi:hypothetical protein